MFRNRNSEIQNPQREDLARMDSNTTGGNEGSYRIERDSLGEVQVPADAWYGAQTARAIRNFPITGLRPHPTLVRATVLVKRAAAEVNRDLDVLDAERANAIIAAAER